MMMDVALRIAAWYKLHLGTTPRTIAGELQLGTNGR